MAAWKLPGMIGSTSSCAALTVAADEPVASRAASVRPSTLTRSSSGASFEIEREIHGLASRRFGVRRGVGEAGQVRDDPVAPGGESAGPKQAVAVRHDDGHFASTCGIEDPDFDTREVHGAILRGRLALNGRRGRGVRQHPQHDGEAGAQDAGKVHERISPPIVNTPAVAAVIPSVYNGNGP